MCYLFHAMIVYYTKANEVAGKQSLKDDELENYLYFVVILAFLDNLCTHICFYSLILILKHLYFFYLYILQDIIVWWIWNCPYIKLGNLS